MFFNLQRWSLHDGPGIRTTVFFKGCPLRCRWCSNPESWSFQAQLVFQRERCTGCGNCIAVCPASANRLQGSQAHIERTACRACGRCVDGCPGHTREVLGREMAPREIIGIITRDAVFYRSSGGGVTFSGGEPLAQPGILAQLARGCAAAGVPTAMETSGYFSMAATRDIWADIDDIYIDLKHSDDTSHQRLTGVSNHRIIANIRQLDAWGHSITIRIPLVSNLTDTPENIAGTINLCHGLENLRGVELLPYHALGAGKYQGLGLPYDARLQAPGKGTLGQILGRFRDQGIAASVMNAGEDTP